MLVLGIESSCDESAVCLLNYQESGQVEILSEQISSQVELHALYGGVVPELASREHLYNLPLLVDTVFKQTQLELNQLNLIAVTRGPGLKGCLLVGVNFAKGLAVGDNIPLVGVNHIEGHLLAAFLNNPDLKFPFIALIVSGGHTEIVSVEDFSKYKVITRTTDDAAGEAFDKSANLLGFDYPGGAKLAMLADTVKSSSYKLPRVMREAEGFSFSGLKTAIALLVKRESERLTDSKVKAELAFAIQESIIDALSFKLEIAIKNTGCSRVVVSGGVAANLALRKRLSELKNAQVFFPKQLHCVDNAAMIAYTGALRFIKGDRLLSGEDVLARWPIEEIG